MFNQQMAWHYTTGEKFTAISESQMLLPTDSYIDGTEAPILWFSTKSYFEPTACKARLIAGKVTTLTMMETFDLGGGLVRFAVDESTLIHWKDLPHAANMSKKTAKKLERSGKAQGANPKQWRGILTPVLLSDVLEIEVLEKRADGDFKWTKVRG